MVNGENLSFTIIKFKIGTIKSIISYLGDGNNIYLVDVDGVDKTCVESNLRISRKKYTALLPGYYLRN